MIALASLFQMMRTGSKGGNVGMKPKWGVVTMAFLVDVTAFVSMGVAVSSLAGCL